MEALLSCMFNRRSVMHWIYSDAYIRGREAQSLWRELHNRCSFTPGKMRTGCVFEDKLGSSMEGPAVCLGARPRMGNKEKDRDKMWTAEVCLRSWHSSCSYRQHTSHISRGFSLDSTDWGRGGLCGWQISVSRMKGKNKTNEDLQRKT